jgi:hypothetical protein
LLVDLPDEVARDHFDKNGILLDDTILDVTSLDEGDLKKCLSIEDSEPIKRNYMRFLKRYSGDLNALDIGVSTWLPIENQRKLVRDGKRAMREFCYIEKNLAQLCAPSNRVFRFLEKYIHLEVKGRDLLASRYPDLVDFHENYCKSSKKKDKERECDRLNIK